MTKKEGIEKWIEQNVQVESTSYEGFWWKQGAKAMAEHLEEQQNELWEEKWRADGIIDNCMKQLHNRIPTKADILKVIRMLKDPCGAIMDLTYSDEETANIILNNWKHF